METIGEYLVVRAVEAPEEDLQKPGYFRIIEDLTAKGEKNFAVYFIDSLSVPPSRQISFLLQCIEYVEEKGGRLAVIVPDKTFRELLIEMGICRLIRVFRSGEDMRLKIA